MTVIEDLEEAIQDGYLLHGSNVNAPIIKNQMNRKIYATDSPIKALWFAILPPNARLNLGRRPPREMKKGYIGLRTTIRQHEAGYALLSRHAIDTLRPGYIYILPAESFKRSDDPILGHDEFISTEDEVIPHKIIPVELADCKFPIVPIDSAEEFRHFTSSTFIGFGDGSIQEVDLPLANSKKKLRIRIREMGIAEIKSILKENRGKRLTDIDWINLAMVGFEFVDDVHGAKPDYKNKKLPISLLLKKVHSALIDAAYPCRPGWDFSACNPQESFLFFGHARI